MNYSSNDYLPYIQSFFKEVEQISKLLDQNEMAKMVSILLNLRESSGRLFILGIGGSAGNAAHAVNDFRKIVGIEAYAPTDNVSELTARANDNGWSTIFSDWLRVSKLSKNDAILVLSVGGGDEERNISPNIVEALKLAQERGSAVLGIVARNGGYTIKVADACVLIPTLNAETVTPHAEAFQAVVWHMLVTHPALKKTEMKWESVAPSSPLNPDKTLAEPKPLAQNI